MARQRTAFGFVILAVGQFAACAIALLAPASSILASDADLIRLEFDSTSVLIDRSLVLTWPFGRPSEEQQEYRIDRGHLISFNLPAPEGESEVCNRIISIGLRDLRLKPKQDAFWWKEVVVSPERTTEFPFIVLLDFEDPLSSIYRIDVDSLHDYYGDHLYIVQNPTKTQIDFQWRSNVVLMLLLFPDRCVLSNVADRLKQVIEYLEGITK